MSGAQELETVDFGAGVRAFVRQHDARAEVFEAQQADEAAPGALAAVGAGEGLVDEVQGRLAVGTQHTVGAPGREKVGGGAVAVGRPAGRRLRQLEVHGVVGAAPA